MNENQEVVFLHLDDIIPNRFQPREVFDEKALKELAISIKEHGVIQPIIVRQINDSKYEIIAGERRYKASALAGLTQIPAIIRNLDDKEAAKVALLENLQRRNLNPIEEARTYQKIIELDQMTQEELAKTMGKSQSAVANKLRLLSLTEEVQKSLLKEEISERHARTLLNLQDPEQQVEMLKKVIKQKMTVRQLENEIKEITIPKKIEKDEIKDEQDLSSIINPAPVSVRTENTENETDAIKAETKAPNLMDNFLKHKESEEAELNAPPTLPPTPDIPNKEDNIINYGEVNDEEDADDDEEKSIDINGNNNTLLTNPINLMDLKNNTKDISNINDQLEPVKTNKSDLDTLLNIKPNLMANQDDNDGDDQEDKKLSPAEKALKESEEGNYENKEDYFKAPNLMSIDLPSADPVPKRKITDMFSSPSSSNSLIDFAKKPVKEEKKNNLTDISQTLFQKPVIERTDTTPSNKSLGSVLMNENFKNNSKNKEEYNIQQMVNTIRETLKELESHGAKIDTDEMNFENQYQILIKIDKNSNY